MRFEKFSPRQGNRLAAHSVRGFLSGAVKAKMRLKITSIKREDGERAYRVPDK
jgi:Protein of unknown function (DUF3489)